MDFNEVKGQACAKRALEIAAAGGHHILMIGSPGSGKTMLARRLPTILPDLTEEESGEISNTYKLINSKRGERPFRSPHFLITESAMMGGGGLKTRPGEVSLAHNGILVLEELAEFKRSVLEIVKMAMENKKIIYRNKTCPANFLLVATTQPCPCGYFGDSRRSCICRAPQVMKYRSRISGSLLDGIDIHVEVSPVSFESLKSSTEEESSENIRKRVESAKYVQIKRLKESGVYSNSQMETKHVSSFCELGNESLVLLKYAMEKLGLSARAYNQIIKVARTIADLEEKEMIAPEHISAAIQYRIF